MIEKTNVKADGLFSEAEAEFLAENFIGRLATVSSGLQPHVVPVAYRFDGSGLTFGGWNMEKSLKFKNLTIIMFPLSPPVKSNIILELRMER